MERINRNIICIDLKSFFASCECLRLGLDPFTYPLVVANPNQGQGAITLAVTPYLKKQGVPSRGRLFEIDKRIKYKIVEPHMNLYATKSKEVINVYLDYVSEDDLHVYSIDECFLDVTHYLKLYKKTDYELALEILQKVKEKTGLTATAGIGPNLLLAKVSMDIEAKHEPNGLSKWTYDDVKTKLWSIAPLSKMWGIGKRMERNLNTMGIYSVKDLALYDKGKLKDKFGIMGKELWLHANGIDNSVIADFRAIHKDQSYSHSQVLFKDYDENNVLLIVDEMIDVLCARLRKNHKQCTGIGFGIGYSKNIGGGFYHSTKLENPTDNEKEIRDICHIIFARFYEFMPIRKVSISCQGIVSKVGVQLNLFENPENIEKSDNISETIDDIKARYGKNSLLKASALLKDSTAIARNKKVGGHNAE